MLVCVILCLQNNVTTLNPNLGIVVVAIVLISAAVN